MSDPILYEQSDGIGLLTVNRPHARNALNWAAQTAFADRITAVSQDPAIRALIITGSGDKAFVAGGDLKELRHATTTADGARLNRIMGSALQAVSALPIPVIAAINGDAFGGGCEILTACDLRIATPHARFSFAQIKNAVTSGWGGTARLVSLIGQSRAMELMLSARLIDAREAQHIGLIHRIADGSPVVETAVSWAKEITRFSAPALAAIKHLVKTAASAPPEQVNQLETELFVALWTQPDHLESLAAFNEKRPPRFNQP